MDYQNTERRILYIDSHIKNHRYPDAEKYLLMYKEDLSKRRECLMEQYRGIHFNGLEM